MNESEKPHQNTDDLNQARAISMEKISDCGPGLWWFIHHPDNFLIECGSEWRAKQIAVEINAGRAALAASEQTEAGRHE